MRHLAFYRALAQCPDDVCDVWRTVSPGLLVLRYFDWWLADGGTVRTAAGTASADPVATGRIDQALRDMPSSARQARRLLQHLIDLLGNASPEEPTIVVGAFLAYARYLEDRREDRLSADVLHAVIDALWPALGEQDPHTAAVTLLRLANLHRRQGALGDAAKAYERAIEHASHAEPRTLRLTIEAWRAGLWRDMGNLGDADTEYTRLLLLADGHASLCSLLLRGRGATRQRRGVPDDAIRDFYHAFTLASTDTDREVILGDLASCAAQSGLRALARDVHTSLATHARSAIARGYALANCFEHAIIDKNEPQYHALRHRLRTECDFATLPAELELYVAYLSARGLERFGERAVALAAYEEVAAHASRTQRHHIEHEVRARIGALRTGAATSGMASDAPPTRAIPASLADIAAAVAGLDTQYVLQVHSPAVI